MTRGVAPPIGRIIVAGMFELFVDADSDFRFRLTAPDGTVMAVSKAFATKAAAVTGIAAVREYAGMGLIADLSPAAGRTSPRAAQSPSDVHARDSRRLSPAEIHAVPSQRVVPRRIPGSAGAA